MSAVGLGHCGVNLSDGLLPFPAIVLWTFQTLDLLSILLKIS